MKLVYGFFALHFLLGLLLSQIAEAADSLANISDLVPGQAKPSRYSPGAWIVLPDGIRSQIIREEPEGLRTDAGVLISPEGIILEGDHKGALVKRAAENGSGPERGAAKPVQESALVPEQRRSPLYIEPGDGRHKSGQGARAEEQQEQEEITLAQLLPVTDLSEPKSGNESQPGKKSEISKPRRAGVALRIPDDAAKTGNVAFLEGCWQGTRPEYNTKRLIRECFCFGKNGKNGKRRIFDPATKKRCRGSSQATLSANGVLSVVSPRAYCQDGSTWGRAEMTCRNSGAKTPCSWIFGDARNGRQAYKIPFLRVESCGK